MDDEQLQQDLLQQLMASFREELAERLSSINAALLILEQNPEPEQQIELLEELFRHVHSLKGAARAVNLKPIEEMAHGMEDVFGAAKRGSIVLNDPLFDLLYQGIDLIGTSMASVEAGTSIPTELDLPGYLVRLASSWREQPIQAPQIEQVEVALPTAVTERAAPPTEPAVQPWTTATIRVPTARLDDLMAQAGELLVTRLRVAQQLEDIDKLYDFVQNWQKDWQQIRSGVLRSVQASDNGAHSQLWGYLERNETHLQTLLDRLGQHMRRVSDDANRLSLVTDELQDGVKRVRMLPLATLVGSYRRMVRDLAREKGVNVLLEVRGADTEMDKHILEQIKDPLMHLLRNCIDHGIESPKRRAELGKRRQGRILLNAERKGNAILVAVSDDGSGIDVDAVREAAVRRGILTPEAASGAGPERVIPLIFSPGLSTSPIITEVSGRGIGLDVVRKNVETLQGRVEVDSAPNQGTTFTLTLPLTLVSTRCLLVRVAGQPFALALSAVERLVSVKREAIVHIEGKEAIRYQGRPLSLARLATVLELTDPGWRADQSQAPAVVLGAGGQQVAFLVDELWDEQDLVVKTLGKQLARVPNVAGATVMGTGHVVLILNVADLVKSAQMAAGHSAATPEVGPEIEQQRNVILIVDDSITTRTLEKNILTTAGYDVKLALDGREALAALAEGPCDLIVADIDMPHMDGFELTEHLKQDQRYGDLPIILVTSLDSPAHKARGIEAGADAYIVKSAFDQDSLLDTIRQLI